MRVKYLARVILILALPGIAPTIPAQAGARVDSGSLSRRAQAYQFYSLAQQALLGRDYAMALQLMERAAERDPRAPLLLELAELQYALHDLMRAGELAGKVSEADPDLPGLHRLLGGIHATLAREGRSPDTNTAEAIDHYRQALRADPTDAEACRELAGIYYGQARFNEAANLLQSFSSRRNLDATMSLLLGKVYARTGQHREAEEILLRSVARYPHNLEMADTLARLFEYQERIAEAIEIYRKVRGTSAPSAYLQRRLGALYLQEESYQEASRELEIGMRLDPRDKRGLLLLAQAYDGSGRVQDALHSFEGALAMDAGNLEAHLRKAHFLQRQGRLDEAREDLGTLISRAGARSRLTEHETSIVSLAHSQIGLIDLEQRDYAAAARAFRRALDLSTEPGPELFLLLGRSVLEDGRPDAAHQVIQEAAQRFPANLDLQILEGELLYALGHVGRAQQFYASLLQDHGASPETYVKISEALLRRERFEDAEIFLQEGTRAHPRADELYFARGAANERMGRMVAAERFLAKSIHLNPKNAMALNYLGYMLAERGVKLRDSIRYV
ncbi:MAG: tetratricopeptide repeat protein, partial [Acidobacteria bacterium]|nr:tetratricopeptide repeat protein [Acidobacteriota bacterium]